MTNRRAELATANIIVVKVGSAVLVAGSSHNYEDLDTLAAQLPALYKSGRKIVLVSSGAVASGKTVFAPPVKRSSPITRARHAIAVVGQSLLMEA